MLSPADQGVNGEVNISRDLLCRGQTVPWTPVLLLVSVARILTVVRASDPALMLFVNSLLQNCDISFSEGAPETLIALEAEGHANGC